MYEHGVTTIWPKGDDGRGPLMGRTDPKLPSATAPRQPDQETRGCVVARAWRRRVRHGGLVPAGEMKLGDQ